MDFPASGTDLTDGAPVPLLCDNATRSMGNFYRVWFGEEADRSGHKLIDSRNCRSPTRI